MKHSTLCICLNSKGEYGKDAETSFLRLEFLKMVEVRQKIQAPKLKEFCREDKERTKGTGIHEMASCEIY